MANKPDKEQIFNKIKEIVVDQTDIKPDKIKMDSTLESLDLDSLDVFEIIDALEDAYDIELDVDDSDEDMDTSNLTLANLVDYVEKKLDAKDKD